MAERRAEGSSLEQGSKAGWRKEYRETVHPVVIENEQKYEKINALRESDTPLTGILDL